MSFMVSSANKVSEQSTNNPLSLKKAIKDYQDELFTGLTEDERKEIEQKINEYIRERSKDKDYDKESFKVELDSFIKGLLKEYGFKGGDTFEDFLNSSMETKSRQETIGIDPKHSLNAAADILMNVQSSKSNANEKIAAQSDMITDSDGSNYLVISTPNGLFMRIKMEAGQGNIDSFTAPTDYEKNNPDYKKLFENDSDKLK